MINKIITYITEWQLKNDISFVPVPIDEISSLIFDTGRNKYIFKFSNKYLRNACRVSIPLEYLDEFKYCIEQEEGFTYYSFERI